MTDLLKVDFLMDRMNTKGAADTPQIKKLEDKKMKKLSKILALILALTMVFALASCSGGETDGGKAEETVETKDWTKFHDWQSENWDSKEISYQFTGDWQLDEYDIDYHFVINFYKDGSAIIDQRDINQHSSYIAYGYWSEEKTADGNEIAFDSVEAVDITTLLIDHEYSYSLYEESDGGYSFGYTFALAPGQYFRTVDVIGSSNVTYNTLEAFHTAVDK